MGRTREAKALIRDLERKIKISKIRKKRVVDYFHKLKEAYSKGEILETQYNSIISQDLGEGKTLEEWIQHYDFYIRDCERRINKHKRKIRKSKLPAIILSFVFIAIILSSIFIFNLSFTGLIVQEPTNITEKITEEIPEINITKLDEPYSEEENISEVSPTEDSSPSQEEPPSKNITIPKEPETNISEEINVSEVPPTEDSSPSQGKPPSENITIPKEPETNISEEINISEVPPKEDSSPSLGQDEDLELPSDELGSGELPASENITEEIIPEINITENITEENATITTTQYQAVLGQPVKWKKQIIPEDLGNLILKLPKQAENITVNKISDSEEENISEVSPKEDSSPSQDQGNVLDRPSNELGSEKPLASEKEKASFTITGRVIGATERESIILRIINFFKNLFQKFQGAITGKAIATEQVGEETEEIELEIEIDEIVEYKVEYETPAPYVIEENLENGKRVKIIGPEDVHYENVLAFTELPQETSEGAIKLYHITNNSRIIVETTNYDNNDNGLIDYIEWIVPHLSEQTYELIIEITKAEHLDSNRSFISDIYEEVKEQDNIWSETIPSDNYVRVTFEQELDSSRDITIYPRIISGTPRIEIYEVDGTELIAEFTNLNSNEYNKIYLTNLVGEQDVFDLKVTGGNIEFDYIIDPTPTITWEPPTPPDGNLTENTFAYLNTTLADDNETSAFFDWDNTVLGYWNFESLSATGVYDNSSNSLFIIFCCSSRI